MLTTEAALGHAIKGAIVSLAACLLTACAFQSDVCGKEPTGKLTYYIASVREKKIQGNWGDRTQWVQRQETADGRWALETAGLGEKQEGQADAKMLDSTGAVVWEGRIGDEVTLSSTCPAFAATASEGGGLEVYNLQVGPKPLFSDRDLPVRRIHLSRDGRAFGAEAEDEVVIISARGDVLQRIPLPGTFDVISVAIADYGLFAAVGGSDAPVPSRGAKDSLHTTTVWVPDSLSASQRSGSEGRPGWGSGHFGKDSRLAISRPHPRVVVFDHRGRQVGQINLDRTLPHHLALSGSDPPEVSVISHHEVALWTSNGKLIWEDTLSLSTTDGREGLKSMYITDDGRLFACTVRSDTTATFWAWEQDGVLETRLPLPATLQVQRSRTRFLPSWNAAVGLQVGLAVTVIGWRGGAK